MALLRASSYSRVMKKGKTKTEAKTEVEVPTLIKMFNRGSAKKSEEKEEKEIKEVEEAREEDGNEEDEVGEEEGIYKEGEDF